MLFGNSSPAGTGNQSTWLSGDGHFLSLFIPIPCPPTIPSCKRPVLSYIKGSVNGHTLTCRLAVSMPPVRGECPAPAFYAAGHTCNGLLSISRIIAMLLYYSSVLYLPTSSPGFLTFR